MIPAVMIAPDVMINLPRSFGLAHSDCQVGMATEISRVYRRMIGGSLLEVTMPLPTPPTILPTTSTA